jgi:hypothetical protein
MFQSRFSSSRMLSTMFHGSKAERGENDADQDRHQDEPHQHAKRRAAEPSVHCGVGH